jgi:hypothetical protein
MEILCNLSFSNSLALKHLGEVPTQHRHEFTPEVVRKTIRLVERDVHSGHLPMSSDKDRLTTPK